MIIVTKGELKRMKKLMEAVTTPQEYMVLQLRTNTSRLKVAEAMRCSVAHVYSIENKGREKCREVQRLMREGFGDD